MMNLNLAKSDTVLQLSWNMVVAGSRGLWSIILSSSTFVFVTSLSKRNSCRILKVTLQRFNFLLAVVSARGPNSSLFTLPQQRIYISQQEMLISWICEEGSKGKRKDRHRALSFRSVVFLILLLTHSIKSHDHFTVLCRRKHIHRLCYGRFKGPTRILLRWWTAQHCSISG